MLSKQMLSLGAPRNSTLHKHHARTLVILSGSLEYCAMSQVRLGGFLKLGLSEGHPPWSSDPTRRFKVFLCVSCSMFILFLHPLRTLSTFDVQESRSSSDVNEQ